MRVNAKKSVVMHFTKKDIANPIVIETECGGCFSSPKPKEGKLSHKHLGFMLDSKLSGSSHIAKMRGTYMSELSKVEEVYKVMGESMALLYLSVMVHYRPDNARPAPWPLSKKLLHYLIMHTWCTNRRLGHY